MYKNIGDSKLIVTSECYSVYDIKYFRERWREMERDGEREREPANQPANQPASSVSQADNASAQASGNVTISFLKSSVRVFTVPAGIDRGGTFKGELTAG